MSGLLERKDAALLVAVAALLTRVVGDVNDELHQFLDFFPSVTCHEQISILVIRWSKDSRKSMRTHCYWPERKRLELKPKHLRTNWGKNDGPQNVHGKDHDNAMRMAQRAYLWTFVNTEMWLSAHACPTTIPVIVALKFVLMPRLKEIIESFGEAASFQENSGNVINSFFSNI